MRVIYNCIAVIFSCLFSMSFCDHEDVWGFYGHKLINRTAVFTLPVDLLPLYKSNLNFVVEHSVDPDKRRHAAKLEAVRHYIDIDNWGVYPFEEVPRKFHNALIKYGQLDHIVEGDTIASWSGEEEIKNVLSETSHALLRHEVQQNIFSLLDNEYLRLPIDWIGEEAGDMMFSENFSEFGILPYHLLQYQQRLTKAFREKNWPLAIRLSTELGHYISDGHVPLHTTLNYNGQLTGQDGIHAFWESRIPELFAEKDYDLFTGRAKYIDDVESYIWNFILNTHLLVEPVLRKELELRESFDTDQQYCFDQRNDRTVRIQCEEYAKAYSESLGTMVEDQMRKSIAAVGSMWYTAWVDAGRPEIPSQEAVMMSEDEIITIDSTLMIKE